MRDYLILFGFARTKKLFISTMLNRWHKNAYITTENPPLISMLIKFGNHNDNIPYKFCVRRATGMVISIRYTLFVRYFRFGTAFSIIRKFKIVVMSIQPPIPTIILSTPIYAGKNHKHISINTAPIIKFFIDFTSRPKEFSIVIEIPLTQIGSITHAEFAR